MSVAIDIPDRLADLLYTLAIQRGLSIEDLSEQVLTVGLTALYKNESAEIIDIGSVKEFEWLSGSTLSMRSPIIARSPVRPLHITFEPNPEASADEN